MLRAVADATGLTSQVTAVLADTYRGPWVHEPGRVFADLACAVADGADCISGIGTIGDRSQHGSVASSTTAWRLVDSRVDAAHLPDIQAARAYAREKAWAAGAAPGRHRVPVAGCTSIWTPRSASIIPTTRRTPPRHGSTRSGSTRCWRS